MSHYLSMCVNHYTHSMVIEMAKAINLTTIMMLEVRTVQLYFRYGIPSFNLQTSHSSYKKKPDGEYWNFTIWRKSIICQKSGRSLISTKSNTKVYIHMYIHTYTRRTNANGGSRTRRSAPFISGMDLSTWVGAVSGYTIGFVSNLRLFITHEK